MTPSTHIKRPTHPSPQPLAVPAPPGARLWDVFCRVVDNHGDLGVLWRLACQLAQRGHAVRLWVDDASALAWMAPDGHAGVQVYGWGHSAHLPTLQTLPEADVWIEGFGCEIELTFIANYTINKSDRDHFFLNLPVWINLEYLTAELYATRCHGLPSPVMSGPGKGRVKRFHYPGFTPDTGGLLREPDLPERQRDFNRANWLRAQGICWRGENLVSLFCYEPAALAGWLRALAAAPAPTLMLITHGRAEAAVAAACQHLDWPAHGLGNLRLHRLQPLTQTDYDHMLWACDLNCVRGEDSLVRALWARKPFVWHIYPQHDGAHHDKLNAFLDWAEAPAEVRQFHRLWNAQHAADTPGAHSGQPASAMATLTLPDWSAAAAWAHQLADRLWVQPDLVTHLLAALPPVAHARVTPPISPAPHPTPTTHPGAGT